MIDEKWKICQCPHLHCPKTSRLPSKGPNAPLTGYFDVALTGMDRHWQAMVSIGRASRAVSEPDIDLGINQKGAHRRSRPRRRRHWVDAAMQRKKRSLVWEWKTHQTSGIRPPTQHICRRRWGSFSDVTPFSPCRESGCIQESNLTLAT